MVDGVSPSADTQLDLVAAIEDATDRSATRTETASEVAHDRRVRQVVSYMLPGDTELADVGGTVERVDVDPPARFDVTAVVKLAESPPLHNRKQLDAVGFEPVFYGYTPGEAPAVEVGGLHDSGVEYGVTVVYPE